MENRSKRMVKSLFGQSSVIARHFVGICPAFARYLAAIVMMIVLGMGSAWGADYVITYTSGSTTYYLARNGTSGVTRVSTFDPTTCIWTCYSSSWGTMTENTLNKDDSRYLAQTVDGTKYYLTASLKSSGSGKNKTYTWTGPGLSTTGSNVWRGNNNKLYANTNNRNGAINLSGSTPSITDGSTSGNNNYYTISSDSYTAASSTTFTADPTVTPATATLSYGENQQFTATGAAATTTTYAACTKYTFNSTTLYYYNNTAYTTEDAYKAAAGTTTSATITYTWALSGTGTSYLSKSDNGATTTVTHSIQNTSDSDKTATLTVTAKAGSVTKTATATVTATAKTPTSLTFNSNDLTVNGTTSFQLPGTTLKNSQTSAAISGTVTYTSSNTSVATVDNTGKVTINGAGTTTITAKYAGDDTYAATTATLTITVANVDALDEASTTDIAITPATQTLDVGETKTYTASASIKATTRKRDAYQTITAGGNTVYKQGANYSATEPKINITEGAEVPYTSFNWSLEGDNGYVTLNNYYVTNSNSTTVTRAANLTDTQKTVTLKVAAVYGSYNKSATASIVIPLTYVDIAGISCDGLTLNYGESGQLNPNTWISSAGAKYVSLTYSSADETIATVDENGQVTATGVGTTEITIQSKKQDGTNGPACTANITVNKLNLEAPTITIEGTGRVTITDNNDPSIGAEIYYTIDGTDPTASSTLYAGPFFVTGGTNVKAIAIKDDNYNNSKVVAQIFATTGVDGDIVTLNDYEDHNWTYYQPNGGVSTDYNYPDKLSSPYPRNVKITYYGNGLMYTGADGGATTEATGVAVGIDASANTFVYYKTLERDANDRFPYELIPNPFSKRPTYSSDTTTKWRGFYKWRVKTLKNGAIYAATSGGSALGEGSLLDAETQYYFQPTDNAKTNANNATSMEVELEAVWARAYVVTGAASNLNTYITSSSLQADSYERNFVVLTSGTYASTTEVKNTKPVTVTMVTPDGATDYRKSTVYINPQRKVTLGADMKFEYINFNATIGDALTGDYWTMTGSSSTMIYANMNNLTMGRGVDNTTSGGLVAYEIVGYNSSAQTESYSTTTEDLIYNIRIESGNYHFACSTQNWTFTYKGGEAKIRTTYGCDYDRATGDNDKMKIRRRVYGGNGTGFTTKSNIGKETITHVMKSGQLGSDLEVGNGDLNGSTNSTFYATVYFGVIGYHCYKYVTSQPSYAGIRSFIMEGGIVGNLVGGSDNGTGNATTDESIRIRLKGGTVRGAMYGGATQTLCQGTRTFVVTGGTVNGWVAGGANGTATENGMLSAATYMYIGGNANINSNNSTTLINRAVGGNVFGAGCGYGASSSSGQVSLGTNVVVADDAYIERGVYGGGSYGYTEATSNLWITGGHVEGKKGGVNGTSYDANILGGVYGGACQNKGGNANIYMTGGKVEGGVFGGSNSSGTLSGYTNIHIDGGQVGTETATANVHGGGYGSSTVVSGNVDITLGTKTDGEKDYTTEGDAVIYGDVYGGSALGKVNGTAANTTYHTNVTLNAGTINGSLYGGALGDASTAANVYAPVAVKVYGGSVKKTDENGANGSGGVYGANNINGAPQSSVTVDIYGTDPVPGENQYALYAVYGGGNKANYTYGNGYPKVTVHNCDNSIEYVYGGGNAAAVSATDVTIYGGNIIGNVFGGGNGTVSAANVNGNATTKIYGGTILNVYGGSNTNGTISGTISVTADETGETGHDACKINVTDLYGGGNKAASAAGNITIGCADHIGTVYGGANQADITGDINLSITSGHIDNVFGGNNNSGTINGNITVTVNDAKKDCGMVVGNVYGGGNLAAFTGNPTVNILNGNLTGSVFGGGKGTTAVVTGNPSVNVGDWEGDHAVTVAGSIYGGGDEAAVEGNPTVIIRDCQTEIGGDLYGGGNAAPTYSTNTTMWGGTVKGNVFGGGNGSNLEKPGANIGYASDNTTKAGTGNSVMNVYGGTVGTWTYPDGIPTCVDNTGGIFGGSNTNGNIAGTATLTIDKVKCTETGASQCDMRVLEVYGAGNKAAFDGKGLVFNLGCVENLDYVYGGAKAADLNLNGGELNLLITSGTFKGIFGGNNLSGNLNGKVTVTIDETGCSPIIIDEVYGAGNLAPYEGNPKVKVISCTSIGKVFGGGLGTGAVVNGNPSVDVQMIPGNYAEQALGSASAIGAIGYVYGGGNAAAVTGNTTVNVATDATVKHTDGTGTATAPSANITGNVYGGGNEANVSGKTNVTIGQPAN